MANVINQSDAWLLLKEAFARLQEKSPKFFRVLTRINYGIALVGIIPTVLTWFNVILPPRWAEVLLKVIAFAGAWGALMANLVVSKPPDETAKEMQSRVLPFTEKKEIEKEIKEVTKQNEADNFKPPTGS